MARSRVAQRLGLRLGLESDGGEYNEDAVLGGEDTVEGELLEVEAAQEEAEGEAEAIDELEEAADGLGEVAEDVEASMEDGGLSPQAARFMQHAVESYTNRLGVAAPVVTSMESFGGTSGRLSATQVSLEGIKEFLKEIWAKIKSLIMSLFAKAKNLWIKLFDAAGKLAKRAEAIKKKARDTSGTASEKKIEVNLKPIHLGGKAPNPVAAAKQLKDLVDDNIKAKNEAYVNIAETLANLLGDWSPANQAIFSSVKALPLTGFRVDKRFGDNVQVETSGELPGGRMMVESMPANAKQFLEQIAGSRGYITDFAEKSKDVDTGDINTMSLGDIENVCDSIESLANKIIDYRKGWEKRSKAQSALVTAGDKLEKSTGKDDELTAEQKSQVRMLVRGANNIVRLQSGVIDASSAYAVSTSNALLNVAAKSLAQYK